MGKSTVSRLLKQMGIKCVDSDDLARKVVEPGQPTLEMIRAEFGEGFIGPQGRLDRSGMASLVFDNEEQRKKLEGIIHPLVRDLWLEQVKQWEADQITRGVVIIPLLFEVGVEGEFDRIICIACTGNTQFERLRTRGWKPEQIKARIKSQMDISEKMNRSDYVIWNEGSLDEIKEQLRRIFS